MKSTNNIVLSAYENEHYFKYKQAKDSAKNILEKVTSSSNLSSEWQSRRVKNPETGNMVYVSSLPIELQQKYKPKKKVTKEVKKISWKKPDTEEEHDEIMRQAKASKVNGKELKQKINNTKATEISDDVWSKLGNTDSWETDTLDKVAKLAKEYGRDYKSILKGFGDEKDMPAPMIIKKNNKYELIGGNTRLMVARALGIRPKVIIADMDNK